MTLTASLFLISTLASVGLGALAASLAPGHWFKRTLGFLLAPALLLLVPAFEPFLVLVLEGTTVAFGVTLWRSRQPLGAERPARGGPRFSLESLLCIMALCGMAAAVIVRLPANNREGWQSILVVGLVAGLATLVGAWAATKRWWFILPALVVALLLAVGPALADWFIISVVTGFWPPDPPDASNPFSLIPDDLGIETTWLAIIPATVFAVFVVTLLLRVFIRSECRSVGRMSGGISAALIAVVTATPSAAVLYLMLTPVPIPRVQLPEPNGYEELVEAGRLSEKTLANSANFDRDTAKPGELAQAASEAMPAIELARRALARECVAAVDYTSIDNLPMEEIGALRNLARAMAATGRFHSGQQQWDEAIAILLDTVHVGVSGRRGGLLIDGIVGIAIVGVGQAEIHRVIDQLTPEQCREAIVRLQALQRACEPFAIFESRDRVWTAHATGWAGRLQQILERWEKFEGTGIAAALLADDLSFPFKREIACTELLVAELALRAFKVEQDRTPWSWDNVLGAGGPALAVDPFDREGNPLRFVLVDEKPVLYSVGPNGIDDRGVVPDEDEIGWPEQEGDLRLDVLWAPQPGLPAVITPSAAPIEGAGAEGASPAVTLEDDESAEEQGDVSR